MRSARGAGAGAATEPRAARDLARRLAAEALGTAGLLGTVVGSGVMAERLAAGDAALALLISAIATGAALAVLITILGPVSGAHLNPAVTLVLALRRALDLRAAGAYVAAQLAGAAVGVWTAHLMFAEPWLQVSGMARDGLNLVFSEAVATFGLVMTVLGTARLRPEQTGSMVGLYIVAAYWFTASTSFANPAVTVARAFSDTFAGIAPVSVPGFVAAQLAGAIAAAIACGWLFGREDAE
jgi:glycerol uptake facilitator-like aquaporin